MVPSVLTTSSAGTYGMNGSGSTVRRGGALQFVDRGSELFRESGSGGGGRPPLLMPRAGQRIFVEEVEQQVGHFLAAGIARVGAVVGGDVVLEPDQPVELARLDAVGPGPLAPRPRRGASTVPWPGSKFRSGSPLIWAWTTPACGERPFMGDGVPGSTWRGGVAGGDPARKVWATRRFETAGGAAGA